MAELIVGDVEALGAAVEGRSDDEILGMAKDSEGGIKGVLDKMFEAMPSAFKPEAAAGTKAVVQYDIVTPDRTLSYSLHVDNGTCEMKKEAAESPRMTMEISTPDFIRLSAGKLDGMAAFMSGKLKIRGDMMFGQQIQNWFETPK